MSQNKEKRVNTSAIQIADYLVLMAEKGGYQMTNKRLQKLLYYIQAWHLAINKSPMFKEKIEAWIHGPTIREVYEIYKGYVAKPIYKVFNKNIVAELGKENTDFIDRIVGAYSKYDTATLEFMTHSEKPWQDARKGLEESQISNNEITWDNMENYYSQRLSKVK